MAGQFLFACNRRGAERLAGANMAVALWGNTIPTGALLVVLITMLGPISGAHFNPAVTLIFALHREISVYHGGLYVLAQALGSDHGGFCCAYDV